MALQCTQYPIKTATSTATVKTCIDPDNPATAPTIVDKNGSLLYTWNASNKTFEPQLGSGSSANILPSNAGFGVDETFESLLNLNIGAFTNNTTAIINKLPDNQKELFASSNTYEPYNQLVIRQQAAAAAAAGGGGNGDPDDDSLTTVEGLSVINNVKPNKRNDILRYPLNIENNGQDYIKFSGINYVPQRRTSNSYVLERSPVQGTDTKDILATIYLPIQPTIMDNNTVTWGEEKFGILEMIGSGISLDAMNGASISDLIDRFTDTVTSNGTISSEIVDGIKASLAQKAIGSNNNLLSRLTGAVTNPNLTLLFNSPDLRSFNFNFKLSPRSIDEGKIVRQIIRTFKELMAVQRTAGNLFLEAPCVFDIEYIRGIDLINSRDKNPYDIHPSLNRIKTCALRNFSVNYTPSGSYMTYTDKEGTMTSYDLTMSFTELDPVYYDDYYTNEQTNIPLDQIGY